MTPRVRWWRRPLAQTLLLTLLGALALQIWRPLYHLTDDSMSEWLPMAVESSRKLWHGQWPFVSDHLFGGGYSWLQDGAVFSIVSPFLLLCSPLALTRFFYVLPDVVGTLVLLTTAGAFCGSALFLRRRLELPVTDGWIVFLSLSYTFTVYALLVNASWIMFINVSAAYPVVFAALFARSFWRGALAVAGAVAFSLLGAHPHPFCYLLIFAGLLAVGVAWATRSCRPAIVFATGSATATAAMLPVIVPVIGGFITSWRQGAMEVGFTRAFNLPIDRLLSSWILGPVDLFVHGPVELHLAQPVFVAALAWSAVNLPLLCLLVWRRRWLSRLETVLLLVIAVAAVFIARPVWLAECLAHVPLLRSLRWPFREIVVLHACTHLLALLVWTPRLQRAFRIGALAALPLGATILLHPAPTFNPLPLDRKMIVSGQAAAFQRELTRIYGPHPQLLISAEPDVLFDPDGPVPIPFAAMGAYNYAALWQVVNVAGYSSTVPHSGLPEARDKEPMHWAGIYSPEQAEEQLSENPELLHLTLISLDPIRVEAARGVERHLFSFDGESGAFAEVPLEDEPEPGANPQREPDEASPSAR